MAIVITDTGSHFYIDEGNVSRKISKDCSLSINGDSVVLTDGDRSFSVRYADVTTPSGISTVQLLYDWFEDRQDTGGDSFIYKSTVNSTTTPLNDGETFTGTFEYVATDAILVSIKTDTSGTLYVDFSPDGTNVDSTLSFNYQTDRIFVPIPLSKTGRYTRVRFANDSGSNQTYLRLLTVHGKYSPLTSTLNGAVSENFPAQVVRPTDYFHEVAMSKRQGHSIMDNFGENADVDTGGEEVVASFGGAFDPTTAVMDTAQTFTVSYTSATDGSTANGARILLVTYLDADYLQQTAYHTLGSTGTDVTSFSGLGINRLVVVSFGSSSSTVAGSAITFTATSDGTTQAVIDAGKSVTQQLIFHTQINHNLLLRRVYLAADKDSGGGSPKITFRLYSYSRVTGGVYRVRKYLMNTSVKDSEELIYNIPLVFGGREVIYLTASTSANNTTVSADFQGTQERVS